jgi:hypothetical protein
MPAASLPALSIGGDSIRFISGSTTGVAIPDLADGNPPRFVYINGEAESAATAIYIRPTIGAVAVTAVNGLMLPLDGVPIILNVAGYTHISQFSGSGTEYFKVTPLSNQ